MVRYLSIILGLLIILAFVGNEVWRSKAPSRQLNTTLDHPIRDHQLRLLAIGDFGTGEESQFEVLRQMEAWCVDKKVDALLLLGDNIYPKGVASVDDPNWQRVIEKPLSSPCLKQLKRYALLGNHDYYGNPQAQIDYTEKSDTWRLPGRFYEVNFGELLKLVVIDTNIADVCIFGNDCSLSFAKQSIDSAKTKWVISAGHHPISSAKSKHKTQPVMAWFMKQKLCQSDVYLSGHNHFFEHRKQDDCSSQLFINGGGGASLYEAQPDEDTKALKIHHGFVFIEASQKSLQLDYIESSGEKLYSWKTNQPQTTNFAHSKN